MIVGSITFPARSWVSVRRATVYMNGLVALIAQTTRASPGPRLTPGRDSGQRAADLRRSVQRLR